MALSDPIQVGYAAGQQKANAFPQAFDKVGSALASEDETNQHRKMAFDLLKQLKMLNTKTEGPSLEELAKGAETFAKDQGHELKINYGNNPEQARKNILGIYQAFKIPIPQGKTTTTLDLAPGTDFDPIGGKLNFSSPKTMLSTIGLDNLPNDMEITGFDQKGQPMIRKKKEEKPPTAGQETSALYASRLQQSDEIFNKLENYINHQGVGEAVQGSLPNFLNVLKSEDMQSYQQAQKNFLNALLRRESGAVISPSEFREGKQQYFPQPGDKPDVIAQKKANRDLVKKSFKSSARNAYIPYEETSGTGQSTSDAEPKKAIDLGTIKVDYRKKYGLQ